MSAPATLSMVLRRARALPAPVASVAVNVLVVCTLVSGLVASLTHLQQDALASTLAAEPPDRTVVTASSPYDDEDPRHQDREVRAALQPVVEVSGGDVVSVVETGTWDVVGSPTGLAFAAVTGDGGRVRAAAGRLPEATSSGPLEVAAPPGSGLATGDAVTLRSRTDGREVDATITGTWEVAPTDARWLADLGPTAAVVPLQQIGEVASGGTQARWRAVPSTDLEPARLGSLLDAVTTTTTELQVAATRLSTSINVTTDLPEVLDDRARELTVLRALLLVPGGLLVLVAAAGLLLVAAGLADVRREEEGLLRSRGASHRQLVGPTVTEALLICGGAALVAPPLAAAVVRIGEVRPALDVAAWLGSVVAAAVCAAALCVPVAVRALTGDRGQQGTAERQRRRLLTGLVAVALLSGTLGLLAVVTLRGFGDVVGQASASPTVDPLLVSSPALLLLALVVVAALVLLPLLFRGVAALLDGRGLAPSLGSRFAARAPVATVPLALTVALASGVLAFAAVERASSVAARQARADHVAGADVRVLTPPSAQRAGSTRERQLLASLPGVARVAPAHRADTYIKDLPTEVVLTDVSEVTAPTLLDPGDPGWRDVVAPPWDAEGVGVALPDGTDRVTVSLGGGDTGGTDLWLAGPDGEVLVVPGRLRQGSGSFAVPHREGLRLVSVGTDLPADADPQGRRPAATVTADGVRLQTGSHWFAPGGSTRVSFGSRPLEMPAPVPVVFTDGLAAAASLDVGDTLTMPLLGTPVQARVTATVPALRTVVGGGGVLADLGTALPTLLASGFDADPDEWWLTIEDGAAATPVATTLADEPTVAADVITRSRVLDQLAADPSTGGAALGQVLLLTGTGCLVVGALLLVSVVLLRRPEHAEQARRIGAAGGDRRLLVGALGWEYAVTTGAGVLVGVLAGGVVAGLTLVSMTLGPDGEPLVPAPEMLVPWLTVVVAPLVMVTLPLLTLVWLTRRGHGHGLGALDRHRGGR
ncbi:FtsX-like permease family protein [Nocardioides coralli]|uniref:FtsX-like permease family protein n=1 Tax=Nocardioides coralli TaxID=2872154 RepID=UPI001CA417F2|nr:FtsX-like permease family protein [Nocardioides coralli]QZY28873.1 hypothetical protein K6T13_15715 [Nocardioides coralli]